MSCTLAGYLRAAHPAAHELLMSCTRATYELLLPNSSWATAKQLRSSSPPNRLARVSARRSQTAPERDGALPNSSRALRAPSNCFRSRARPVCKHFRAPKIARRKASSPQNRQALQVQNSTLCLETRPVAATEWELTTPSRRRSKP